MPDVKEAIAFKYTCKTGSMTIGIVHSARCLGDEKKRSSIHRWSLLLSIQLSALTIVYPKAYIAPALNSR